VRAPAIRKVTAESSTGSTVSKRVHTTLSIRVSKIDFDPGASQLHVGGKVVSENDFVGLGQYHTLDLELHRNFTLQKETQKGGMSTEDGEGGGGWDSVSLAQLRESTDTSKRAEIWAVVMQEGVGNICLITENQTIVRQRVGVPTGRKRVGDAAAHEKACPSKNSIISHSSKPPPSHKSTNTRDLEPQQILQHSPRHPPPPHRPPFPEAPL
jgi:protein pelota